MCSRLSRSSPGQAWGISGFRGTKVCWAPSWCCCHWDLGVAAWKRWHRNFSTVLSAPACSGTGSHLPNVLGEEPRLGLAPKPLNLQAPPFILGIIQNRGNNPQHTLTVLSGYKKSNFSLLDLLKSWVTHPEPPSPLSTINNPIFTHAQKPQQLSGLQGNCPLRKR